MFCPNCGSVIPDGSRFCNMCGARLDAAAPVQAQSLQQPQQPQQQMQQQPQAPYQQQSYQQGQQPQRQIQQQYQPQQNYQVPFQPAPAPRKKMSSGVIAGIAIAAVVALFAICIFLTPIGYMTGIYNKISGNWAAGTSWYQVDSYGYDEEISFTGKNTVEVYIQDTAIDGSYTISGDIVTITLDYLGSTESSTLEKNVSNGTTTLVQQEDNSVWYSSKSVAESSGYTSAPGTEGTA